MMPPAKISPEETYPAFHTDGPASYVAKRLGVTKMTLRRWWIAKFGVDAYAARTHHSPEVRAKKKAEARARYREKNHDRLKEKKKEWVEKNWDRAQEAKRKYREANREKVRAQWKSYYSEKGDRIKARARERRSANLDAFREKDRQYARLNPDKVMFKSAKGRAKRFGLPFDITLDDVRAAIPADGRCPITGQDFIRNEGKGGGGPQSMSLDRVIPELGYVRGNIRVISHLANTLKNNCTDPQIFRRLASYLEADV